MLKLFASSATHAGRIRASNEDRALVADDLVAVADGMGGHVGGEIAAEMAVERFASDYDLATGLEGLIAAARRANRAVYQRSEAEPTLRGMGTTLTAAALVRENGQEVLHVINIGDSRAYFLEGNRVIQISEDHSLAEEMVRHGELTPEMALVHPHRHIITRAVGIEPEVGVDAFSFEAHAGMRLLVASDGLTNEVNDQEIAAILSIHLNREEAAATLLQTALAHGGSDNITVIVADVLDDEANDAMNLDLATSGGGAAQCRSPSRCFRRSHHSPRRSCLLGPRSLTKRARAPRVDESLALRPRPEHLGEREQVRRGEQGRLRAGGAIGSSPYEPLCSCSPWCPFSVASQDSPCGSTAARTSLASATGT